MSWRDGQQRSSQEYRPMETHWTFSGCDLADETLVARYWDKRLLELEGKLNALSEEPSELRLALHHDDGSPAWELQVALHVAGATLAAENAGDELEEVLDAVICELARQMDEHEEHLAANPGQSARRGLETVARLLRRNHAQGRSAAFFALLQGVMRRLNGYLQHALETLESEDGLPSEDITLEDVLDESMARAWDRFGAYTERRSQEQPLDEWMREIVDGVLQQSNHQLAQRSLDDEVGKPTDDADDPLQDVWTEAGGYPQAVELAELVTGHPGVDARDRLSAEAENTPLAKLLNKLPRDQRQALVLSLTEGFSEEEIADFQGRSTSEVEQDIQVAQQTLRREIDEGTLEALGIHLAGGGRRPRRRR
jgi:RNA polymerase sigma factor (sigma-70 family)